MFNSSFWILFYVGRDASGKEIFLPLKDLLPMVAPNDIVFDGWDISSMNLGEAMKRAQVFEVPLQTLLYPHLEKLKPRPSIFSLDFVAPNQAERADNVLTGPKWEQIERVRRDIRDFKRTSRVDKVIVLWTANTERFCDTDEELNGNWDNLKRSIERENPEVSPSTMFAVASILEGVRNVQIANDIWRNNKEAIAKKKIIKFRREIIRGFGSSWDAFLERTLFTCKNHHCRVADVLLTNITMFDNKNLMLSCLKSILYISSFNALSMNFTSCL